MRIDITMPASWADLSQVQLRRIFQVIVAVQDQNQNVPFRDADDYAAQTAAQVATTVFFEWSGLQIVCPYAHGYLVSHNGEEGVLDAETVTAAIVPLGWAKELPTYPVRLDVIDGAHAVPADISSGLSFDSWLACENNWQAYQLSQDPKWLREMATVLYNKENISLDHAETLSIFYWWAGVKSMVSEMFPSFFHPATGDDEQEITADSLRRNMDAQIRALTKGDITKENEILAMDAIRALTELDAQAREYEELNRKYPKK